jgi:twitching motility protein PilT
MPTEQPIDNQASSEHGPELNKFFRAAIKTRASDLHLKVGQPPKLRLFGELKNTTGEVMTAQRIEELVYGILSPAQKESSRRLKNCTCRRHLNRYVRPGRGWFS